MKIQKTHRTAEGSVAHLKVMSSGTPTLLSDDSGKLAVLVNVWVPDADGNAEQLEVRLSDGDVERLLTAMSNPSNPALGKAVAKVARENLRSLLRLTALGAGTQLAD